MKLYNFSCRKYQHNVDTAIRMLRNRGNFDKAEEVVQVADRNGVFCCGTLCPMPYRDWDYLMRVVRWAQENGSGCGYL